MKDLIFTLVCMVVSIADILDSLSLLSSIQSRCMKRQLLKGPKIDNLKTLQKARWEEFIKNPSDHESQRSSIMQI